MNRGSRILRKRTDLRDYFLRYPPRLRRWFRYDLLDVPYFLGYALWNYMLTPFLFTWPGFEISEGEPAIVHGSKLRQLIVKFPPDLQLSRFLRNQGPDPRRVVLKYDHFLRHWRIRHNVATLMWGNLHEIEFIDNEERAARSPGARRG